MRISTRFSCCAAALAAMLSMAPALAADMSEFDLNKLNSWADALAVCDVNRFLLTEPDVNADVLLVPGNDNSRIALYHPLYVPPSSFFSSVIREAYNNVRKAGLVTPESYHKARIHYAGRMISVYRSASFADKRHMRDQMELCYILSQRAGVKLNINR
jgi:hypothetical protein